MSIDLKPCPFCGAEPGARMEIAGLEFVSFNHGPECYFATLKIVGKSVSDPFFAAWNTRAERTCSARPHYSTRFDTFGTVIGFDCSECAYALTQDPDRPILWRYCPNCGAKVVLE